MSTTSDLLMEAFRASVAKELERRNYKTKAYVYGSIINLIVILALVVGIILMYSNNYDSGWYTAGKVLVISTAVYIGLVLFMIMLAIIGVISLSTYIEHKVGV
jgi:sterol desaturase/sphingolipid hydroxylase (fatty acid hydroxylase superfamily)